MVRAKFVVTSIKGREDGEGSEIRMYPVTLGSPENDEFFRWTPAGEIVLDTVNVDAADQFSVGDEFYVDFIKAR